MKKRSWSAPFSNRLFVYGSLALGLLAVLIMAAVPLSGSLVEGWLQRDVELRSRLAYTSIQGPISRALADNDSQRLSSILQGVAEDERILAVGLCDPNRQLLGATRLMPPSFSCEQAARGIGQ